LRDRCAQQQPHLTNQQKSKYHASMLHQFDFTGQLSSKCCRP
jgi:hypothetical protein